MNCFNFRVKGDMNQGKVWLIILCWISVTASVSVSQEQANQQCTPSNPLFFDQTNASSVFELFSGPTGQSIIDSYNFGCNGIITRVEFFCQNNGSLTGEFHVWRPDPSVSGAAVYKLVGKYVLENSRPDENNLLSYSPPEDQRIRVQPGDIVGIRATGPYPFVVQAQTQLGTDVTSYTLNNTESTPTVLNLNNVSAEVINSGVPVMRVTVREFAEIPVTYIAIAVSMGLVITIACVMIIASSWYIIALKRRQPVRVTDTTNITMDEVAQNTPILAQSNIAYNKNIGSPNGTNVNSDYHSYENEDSMSAVYDYIATYC